MGTNGLNIITAADRNSTAILYFLLSKRKYQFLVVLQNIYECHCRVWEQMLLSEPFQTVTLWLLSLSGSENHKSHDNLSFTFSISIMLFLWL